MAAKLILSMDGSVLNEYSLNKERITIGRKPHNDIVIDNLAVSGDHAAIITILSDSFLEDLDSTNGVLVNGSPVKKHFLQNNDLIEIGKYKLKFLSDQQGTAVEADFEKTMMMQPTSITSRSGTNWPRRPVTDGQDQVRTQINPLSSVQRDVLRRVAAPSVSNAAPAAAPVAKTTATFSSAAIQILTGPNAGRELDLVKSLTTLGKPGVQVAVLTRRPQGYFITHVEGVNFPSLNGKLLNEQPHQLNDHDIIELAGIKMEFYFKA
ncbi:MAG: FHA domain-containing protein [Gallionellaceae bacterium]